MRDRKRGAALVENYSLVGHVWWSRRRAGVTRVRAALVGRSRSSAVAGESSAVVVIIVHAAAVAAG